MSKQPKLGKRQRTALVDLVNAGGVWDLTDENIRRCRGISASMLSIRRTSARTGIGDGRRDAR